MALPSHGWMKAQILAQVAALVTHIVMPAGDNRCPRAARLPRCGPGAR